MHPKAQSLIQCPKCKCDLSFELIKGEMRYVEYGEFVCSSCLTVYPVEQDIIYFAKSPDRSAAQSQRETYSYWWDESHDGLKYNTERNSEIFKETIKIDDKQIKGSIVLDAGCGNGRFSSIVAKKKPELLVLFDLSHGITEAYKEALTHSQDVIAIQGDIVNSPFKNEVFDNVYSWGVLHHTGETRKAFHHVSSLVKKKGNFGVYVYENHPVYQYDNIFLRLISILRELLLIRPLRFVSQFLSPKNVIRMFRPIFYLERLFNIGVVGCHGGVDNKFDKNHYFRVVIDRFKSRYATEHSVEEVVRWFIDEGYGRIDVGEGVKVCLTGKKLEAPEAIVSVYINKK